MEKDSFIRYLECVDSDTSCDDFIIKVRTFAPYLTESNIMDENYMFKLFLHHRNGDKLMSYILSLSFPKFYELVSKLFPCSAERPKCEKHKGGKYIERDLKERESSKKHIKKFDFPKIFGDDGLEILYRTYANFTSSAYGIFIVNLRKKLKTNDIGIFHDLFLFFRYEDEGSEKTFIETIVSEYLKSQWSNDFIYLFESYLISFESTLFLRFINTCSNDEKWLKKTYYVLTCDEVSIETYQIWDGVNWIEKFKNGVMTIALIFFLYSNGRFEEMNEFLDSECFRYTDCIVVKRCITLLSYFLENILEPGYKEISEMLKKQEEKKKQKEKIKNDVLTGIFGFDSSIAYITSSVYEIYDRTVKRIESLEKDIKELGEQKLQAEKNIKDLTPIVYKLRINFEEFF